MSAFKGFWFGAIFTFLASWFLNQMYPPILTLRYASWLDVVGQYKDWGLRRGDFIVDCQGGSWVFRHNKWDNFGGSLCDGFSFHFSRQHDTLADPPKP